METKEENWIKTNKYTSLCVDEFKGSYAIKIGNNGKEEGVVYTAWCIPAYHEDGKLKPRKKEDGSYQFIPMQGALGPDHEKAVAAVGALYHQLKNMR